MSHLVILMSLCFSQTAEAGITQDNLEAYLVELQQVRNQCGPRAAWYCLRRLGIQVELKDVLEQTHLTEQGVTLEELVRLLSCYDVPAWIKKGDPAKVSLLPVPAILVIDSVHCVVFNGYDSSSSTVDLFDPAIGKTLTIPAEHLTEHWSGEVLLVTAPRLSWPTFLGVIFLTALGTVVLFTIAPKAVAFLKKNVRRH
jgi:ABC-type bacteriocin/lantibiotic exporter with double-glycine peptidase domain